MAGLEKIHACSSCRSLASYVAFTPECGENEDWKKCRCKTLAGRVPSPARPHKHCLSLSSARSEGYHNKVVSTNAHATSQPANIALVAVQRPQHKNLLAVKKRLDRHFIVGGRNQGFLLKVKSCCVSIAKTTTPTSN